MKHGFSVFVSPLVWMYSENITVGNTIVKLGIFIKNGYYYRMSSYANPVLSLARLNTNCCKSVSNTKSDGFSTVG